MTLDTPPPQGWEMPRIVLAVRDGFSVSLDSPEWRREGDEICGDSGLIGVHDLAHFHDAAVIPSDQHWTFDGGPADPSDL